MEMRLSLTYTPHATYSKEKNGDIITSVHFLEGNLLFETREDAESDDKSSDKSDEDSIMSPLISLEELNVLDCVVLFLVSRPYAMPEL